MSRLSSDGSHFEFIHESEDLSNDSSSSEDLENEESESGTIYVYDPVDYSNYFENIQTIGIFISALLVAYGLAFAFFKGFKR